MSLLFDEPDSKDTFMCKSCLSIGPAWKFDIQTTLFGNYEGRCYHCGVEGEFECQESDEFHHPDG